MRLLVLPFVAAMWPCLALAQATPVEVDLELVLAVDTSYSMDLDELTVQRDGYVNAITSREVIRAIREGPIGRIAATYVEWAGETQQRVVVDWQIIEDEASAAMFADRLAEAPTQRSYRTSISAALDFVRPMFGSNGIESTRKVVDVSGDGPNNQGGPVHLARERLLNEGVTINGLPLMMKTPGAWSMDLDDLDGYYRDCVVGGPGAFVIPVRGMEGFADAVRTKLILEISGIEPDAVIMPAQNPSRALCNVGERMWQDRYGGGGN